MGRECNIIRFGNGARFLKSQIGGNRGMIFSTEVVKFKRIAWNLVGIMVHFAKINDITVHNMLTSRRS